jgi:hypothetical protein
MDDRSETGLELQASQLVAIDQATLEPIVKSALDSERSKSSATSVCNSMAALVLVQASTVFSEKVATRIRFYPGR